MSIGLLNPHTHLPFEINENENENNNNNENRNENGNKENQKNVKIFATKIKNDENEKRDFSYVTSHVQCHKDYYERKGKNEGERGRERCRDLNGMRDTVWKTENNNTDNHIGKYDNSSNNKYDNNYDNENNNKKNKNNFNFNINSDMWGDNTYCDNYDHNNYEQEEEEVEVEKEVEKEVVANLWDFDYSVKEEKNGKIDAKVPRNLNFNNFASTER